MKDWRKTLVHPGESILGTMRIIDQEALQIALVADGNDHLLGVVTDGDIRRALLSGVSLNAEIKGIMTVDCKKAGIGESWEMILNRMKAEGIHQFPIVDGENRLFGLYTLDEMLAVPRMDNVVVLMAGGLGSRLMPLTEQCPKPLLRIGEKPLLEIILENFIACGFHKFYFCINYKGEMIQEHFGDGSRWGVEIMYIHEDKRLGTAGAMSLLPIKPTEPIIIMNGDLLTKIDFRHLLEYHIEKQAIATMCIREYEYVMPYGIVNLENGRMIGIQEKPVQQYYINAGIYVLNPETIELIPKDTFYNMTQLFGELLAHAHQPAAYPVRDYWMDIGRIDDWEKAKAEYHSVFG